MADWLAPADIVANAPLAALSGPGTIDGVTLDDAMRILVRQQEDPIENGVYDVNTAGAWTRSTDFDATTGSNGAVIYVRGGTNNTGKLYASVLEVGGEVGTDPVLFTRTNLRPGVYDPTDYGARTTNTTDGTVASDAAFLRMFADMAPPGYGGPFCTVYIPPTPALHHYFFSEDLHITRACIFEGAGPLESGTGTKLKFAEYKGMFLHSVQNSPDGGAGDGTIVRNMMIEGYNLGEHRPEAHDQWAANHEYAEIGRTVTTLAARSSNPLSTLAYTYEVIKTGRSGATEPNWLVPENGLEVDNSTEWGDGQDYVYGSVVRVPEAEGGRYDVVFCPCSWNGIGTGATMRSGATMPAAFLTAAPEDLVPEEDAPDPFSWACVDAKSRFVADDGALVAPGTGVIWRRRMFCGIFSYTVGRIDNVLIQGFLNAGIGIVTGHFVVEPLVVPPIVQKAGAGYVPPGNANGLIASNVQIQSCGVGIAIAGIDANACSFYDINLVFNALSLPGDDRRIGILEDSFLGNRYSGVQMAGAQGAGVFIPNATNASTITGLYQESDCGANDCLSGTASFWGGATNGFTARSIYYGALAYGWVGVVQTSTTSGGYNIRSTFHDQSNHFIYGFSSEDNGGGGYAMQYSSAALGHGYWNWE